ncbi:MAG: fibronectin type III domain-containing protein [Candidatus Edwardsbacteria bacterium]
MKFQLKGLLIIGALNLRPLLLPISLSAAIDIDIYPQYVAYDGVVSSGVLTKGTPFAVHVVCTGLLPDTLYYGPRLYLRRADGVSIRKGQPTWSNGEWKISTSAWTSFTPFRTDVSGNWQGWVFACAETSYARGLDTLQVGIRLAGADTNIYSNKYFPITSLDMSASGGWLEGHIYNDPGFTNRAENTIVLAFGGGKLLGSWITENNHISEGQDSTNTGYFKLADSLITIDSLQFRNLNNQIVICYTETSPPWTILANQIISVDKVDTIPPAIVNNLSVLVKTLNSITLTWTAPGDDTTSGQASTYDLRYATFPIDTTNWNSSIQVTDESIPKTVGLPETLIVTGLAPKTLYYFALKTADEVSNWSGLSNIASDSTRSIFPLSEIRKNDANGVPLLLNDTVSVRGVITVANQFGKLSFLQDYSGFGDTQMGLAVYDSAVTANVNIGDSVQISGAVTQYNGLTELKSATIDSIFSHGHSLQISPATCLDITSEGGGGVENWEGKLVRLNRIHVTSGTFPPAGSSENVTISDSTGSCTMRIDYHTDIDGTSTPTDTFDIVGILSQYDVSSPYTSGYQLMPRFLLDFGGNGSGVTQIAPTAFGRSKLENAKITLNAGISILTDVSITIPYFWQWDGQMSNITVAGGFYGANISISGNGTSSSPYLITLNGCAVTQTNPGIITISNLYTPAQMGWYPFIMKTAVSGSALKEIAKQPLALVVMPIAEIQATGPDGYTSVLQGKSVLIAGVVTGPSTVFSSGSSSISMFIQDASGGINIYGSGDNRWTLGMKSAVAGIVQEYNGLTEVKIVSSDSMFDLGMDTIPPPKKLLYNQFITEGMEGWLIEVSGRVISEPTLTGPGWNMEIRNGNPAIAIRINQSTGIDPVWIKKDANLRIVGIVGQYDTEPPHDSGYQLLVRVPQDIQVITESLPPSSSVIIEKISPNPFSADLGEVAEISVNAPIDNRLTLRIFDLQGRLVKTLMNNESGGHHQIIWDATNERREKATIGIYVLHLQGTSPSGETKSVTKTLVVGTPLR